MPNLSYFSLRDRSLKPTFRKPSGDVVVDTNFGDDVVYVTFLVTFR